MLNEYHHTDHLVYQCRYHVVFCPKYRKRILKNGLDEFVKKIFRDIAHEHSFQILDMEIMPDHVHLLIDCNPRFGIAKCIGALKAQSPPAMKEYDPSLPHRLPTIWTRGAFIASVGSISIDTVKQYIDSQKGK